MVLLQFAPCNYELNACFCRTVTVCLARSLLELSRVQFALIIFCRILRLRWVLSIHLVLLAKRRTVLELGRQFGVKSKYKYWRVSRSTDLSILKDNKYTWFSLEVFIVTMVTNALAVKCMHGVPHCNFEKEFACKRIK